MDALGQRAGIWHNLPIRVKALACLLLPVPLMELCVIGLGVGGFHRFQLIVLPAAGVELLAFAWVLDSAHRRIRELRRATDRVSKGESWQELRPYCWESNAIHRNLRSLAADFRQCREEKAESREEAVRLFEATPAAYLETDATGVVTRVNRSACQLLGHAPEEVRGNYLWNVLGATEGPASREEFAARVEREEAIEGFDRKYVRPDGTRLMIEIQERLLRNSAGAPSGIWCSLTDRTAALRAAETIVDCETAMRFKEEELAKALAEAAEARQAETRFLSKVSTDLRAPLNAIVGFAELMVDGKVGAKAAERRECLRDILSSARELTGMVDRLLDQAQSRGVEAPSRPETADMGVLVPEVGWRMRALSPPSQEAEKPNGRRAVRRRSAGVAVLQPGVESGSGAEGETGPALLRTALEGAGIGRNCGKPILVAGGTPHGVQELTDILRGLGHDPIGLTSTNDILRTVEREQPGGVVVDVRGDGTAVYESVRGSLCNSGLRVPLVGFCGVSQPAAASDAPAARPRLQSVAGGARKRLASA